MFGYIEKNQSENRIRFVSNDGKVLKQFRSSRYTAMASLDNKSLSNPNNPQVVFGTDNGELALFDLRKNLENSMVPSPFLEVSGNLKLKDKKKYNVETHHGVVSNIESLK